MLIISNNSISSIPKPSQLNLILPVFAALPTKLASPRPTPKVATATCLTSDVSNLGMPTYHLVLTTSMRNAAMIPALRKKVTTAKCVSPMAMAAIRIVASVGLLKSLTTS